MEVSGEHYTLATLPQAKSLQFLLDRRLGELQNQPGHCGRREKSLPTALN
jgi:hypothetical protein